MNDRRDRDRASSSDHGERVTRILWRYADRHHNDELNGGKRQDRPPVFAPHFASKNVLVPPDETKADAIRAAIHTWQWHRWFRSMKSSQALAQSVFAAVGSFGRLDLLQDLAAECGLPAFFSDQHGWAMSFEHQVCGLNEPRPTNVDVLLTKPGRRVAIECKFLENEFGACSRTSKSKYPDPRKHCDGSYSVQNGRRSRCALTEIGIRYWEFLPRLFQWSSDRDHKRCPFRATYQLARNALAATVTAEGDIEPTGGHVLVVYDARNPAFRRGGRAYEQWQQMADACLYQGLFRVLSWQTLLAALTGAPELTYLIHALREKYGLEPS